MIDNTTQDDSHSVLSQIEVVMPQNFRVGSTSSHWGNQDEKNNYPWFETQI